MGHPRSGGRALYLILGSIFFFSGFASLVYQVVWQRLLTTYYGVGTVSIAVIVSIYMLGLGVGGYVGGKWVWAASSRVKLYLIVQLAVCGFGLLSLPFLTKIGSVTAGWPMSLSAICILVFLSAPTVLMGMTLPIVVQIASTLNSNFQRSVSTMYFLNTIGAAAGSLISSFVFISRWGLDGAVYWAVAIDFLLALAVFLIAKAPMFLAQEAATKGAVSNTTEGELPGVKLPAVIILTVGFLAIGYEIIWLRMLSILVKASPYAFSSILSVYLLALAVGSYSIGRLVDSKRIVNLGRFFYVNQMLIAITTALIIAGFVYFSEAPWLQLLTVKSFLTELHPPYSLSEMLSGSNPSGQNIFASFDIIIWPLLFLGIPTIFVGINIPLASVIVFASKRAEGIAVGNTYLLIAVGNAIGGIATTFLFLEFLGTERTLAIFVAVGILMAIGALKRANRIGIAAVIALSAISLFLFPKKGELYRVLHPESLTHSEGSTLYIEEAHDAVIYSVYHSEKGNLKNYINGLSHGGLLGGFNPMFASEFLEGVSHVSQLKDILIVGLGTGSFVDYALRMSASVQVDLVELSPSLIKNLKKIDSIRQMLSSEKLNTYIEDARRFLNQNEKKYDLIMMDPLRPSTAYSTNLYSKEFFKLAARHLNPGGVLVVWLGEPTIIRNTLRSTFKHMRSYERFALVSNEEFIFNAKNREEFLQFLSDEQRRNSLGTVQFIEQYTNDSYQSNDKLINTDRKPRSEFYFQL
ncbi:MAG: hypothetical protein COT74_11110 [Bdellovibrionales bacterium CG10_big_fil_rev_8_21_14_0_10_45_34]|nr:MAG: hypothetical protein COT74_11110 [Bdellovibrionales bacterium CG10_big_fil_rev_8_21_14_0_10_45_34]